MTSEQECYVYLVPPGAASFVTAGRFRLTQIRSGGSVGQFVYGRRYLARPDAVALDPVELGLRRGPQETARLGGFFGAIRDALPDHWGRLVIERNAGVARLDDVDYLLLGPDDRMGALSFGPTVTPPAPRRRFNRTLDLHRLQQTADAIMSDAPELAGSPAEQVEELLLLGTSMGGARPKTVVEDDGALWLAKFGRPDDRWDHPRVEHAFLTLARRCGLNVAHSRLVTVAGRSVLLVRRFDRDLGPDGYYRHRMISGQTLLRSEGDPVRRRRWSYLLLADEIRRASAQPTTDLRELFARMCFNALVSNGDDHLRNHALLAQGKDWRLSPAYDLTPRPALSLDRRDLALVCGDHGRWVNRANLLGSCGRFLLDLDDAAALVDTMVDTVRAGWRSAMRDAGVSAQDCERLASAFLYAGFFYER